jgi:MFS family permease
MPASRRGEGLGYFGVANNLAMAIGPMISLFLHDYYNYDVIFYTAIVAGLFGFVFELVFGFELDLHFDLYMDFDLY